VNLRLIFFNLYQNKNEWVIKMNRFNFFLKVSLILFVVLVGRGNADDSRAKYADYLSALENLNDKKFDKIIVGELQTYLSLFPEAANRDTVQFMLASKHLDMGKEVPAFFAFMQILYHYPNSGYLAETKDRLKTLLTKKKRFKGLRAKVDTVLNPTVIGISEEDHAFALIRDLVEINFKPITSHLLAACNEFLAKFPQSFDSEAVMFWKAELLMRHGEARQALAQFMKVTYLHLPSPYVTTSKLKMAQLFSDELKMHQKAIYTLEEFVLEHPDDPQAPQAQFRIGDLIAKEKKTYLEAINAYAAVAEKYPKSVEAVPALFASAKLYEDKFQEYDQAIRIYTEIVRDFPEDLKAPYAYSEAARIYEKRLKDYHNAANVYFKVYGHYPESSIAPESLFAAAEIHEKKLEDGEKALTYYRLFVEHYPGHKQAKRARKRIKRLSKKDEG